MKRRLLLLAAVMAVAGAVFVAQTSAMATPKLTGRRPGLHDLRQGPTGKKVTKLKAGKYTFVVTDKSPIHNFVVEKTAGGTFEKQITTSPDGPKTVTINLTKGKWKVLLRTARIAMHRSSYGHLIERRRPRRRRSSTRADRRRRANKQVRPALPQADVLDVGAGRPGAGSGASSWVRVDDRELVPVVLEEPDLGVGLELEAVRKAATVRPRG